MYPRLYPRATENRRQGKQGPAETPQRRITATNAPAPTANAASRAATAIDQEPTPNNPPAATKTAALKTTTVSEVEAAFPHGSQQGDDQGREGRRGGSSYRTFAACAGFSRLLSGLSLVLPWPPTVGGSRAEPVTQSATEAKGSGERGLLALLIAGWRPAG